VKAADQILAVFLARNPELAVTEWAEFDSASLRMAREQLNLNAVARDVRGSMQPGGDVFDSSLPPKKMAASKRRI
jgi:hypothetical protein